jgi:hypothetical protein
MSKKLETLQTKARIAALKAEIAGAEIEAQRKRELARALPAVLRAQGMRDAAAKELGIAEKRLELCCLTEGVEYAPAETDPASRF